MEHTFGNNTWPQIKAALEADAPVVAILPCGATEAHGRHLPLNTDVIISDGMAAYALPALEEAGVVAFMLPSLPYAPAEYAAEFAGTLSVSAEAAAGVIFDIARGLKAQGFACLALANSHFDPANVQMLREVTGRIETELQLPVAFPDFTRRKLAQTLTDEFKSGACHAGQYETSLVMASRPELVDEPARQASNDNPASLTDAFAKGAKTFEEAGGPQAYFGYPRAATPDEGVQTYETLAAALVEAIRAKLPA
ncbi:MAG: creatininase family protein [Planctomycetes bacterium]|nr:creatininase family protein [Planctomycetota bacterium]